MNAFLDVRDVISCVEQIAQTKKMIQSLSIGDTLTVRFSDEITLIDFKSFCQRTQHALVDVQGYEDFYEIKILI